MTSARRHQLYLLLLLTAALAACGDSSSGRTDPHVEVFGSQNKSFSLALGGLDISCRKKPCTSVAANCSCSCKCESCTTVKKCTTGCFNTCETMCTTACFDKPSCGKYVSSTGDCPAKKKECLYGAFEFAAETDPGKDTGKYFRFTVADFDPKNAKTYDLTYNTNEVFNQVTLGFPNENRTKATDKDFKYVYFQALRSDDKKTYRTNCSIEINPRTVTGGVNYSGTLYCTMLWADFASHDFSNGTLNAFVDLWGRYTCTVKE